MTEQADKVRVLSIGESSGKFFIFSTPPLKASESIEDPRTGLKALSRVPLTDEQAEAAGFADETEAWIFSRLQFGMYEDKGAENRIRAVTEHVEAKCQQLGNAALAPDFIDMKTFFGQKTQTRTA